MAQPLDDLRLNSLLSAAMYECAQGDPEVSGLDSIFIYYAGSSPAVRGPLSAAYGAALEAYNDVVGSAGKGGFQAGRREGTGEVLELPRPEHTPIPPEESIGRVSSLDAHRDGSGAVVKALEKKGDRVKITFKTEKYIVPDYQCVETSKIDRITPEGQILYRSTCKKVGEHEAESTAQPFEAPAWAVGGIAPGNFVVPSWGKDGAGFVIEAYESKARSKRISLFGIGL